MKVRLFARLREIARTSELPVEVAGPATVLDVWRALVASCPDLNSYASSVSSARNLEYVRMHEPVGEGDEIAFLPPVSGG